MASRDIKLDLPPDLSFSDEELEELSQEFANTEVDRLELRPNTGAVEAKNKSTAKAKAQQMAQAKEVAVPKQQGVQAKVKPRVK